MSKRAIRATSTDSDSESQRAGPSARKRARRASASPSTPSGEPQIRLNGSSSGEDEDDEEDEASLDLDGLEEQIRTHIDASRIANKGQLGVRTFLLYHSYLGLSVCVHLDHRPEGDNRVRRNVRIHVSQTPFLRVWR